MDEVSTFEGLPEGITSYDLQCYKYAPIMPIDVERSL